MAFKVEIKGLRELVAKFDKMPKELQLETHRIVFDGARYWESKAKADTRRIKDKGTLGQGISVKDLSDGRNKIAAEIVSNAEYSAYIEWGTITKVSVPAELGEYAMMFKGKGIRKNGGLIPRPFFFKHGPLARQRIEKGIKSILSEIK